jgi:hypothetical protein
MDLKSKVTLYLAISFSCFSLAMNAYDLDDTEIAEDSEGNKVIAWYEYFIQEFGLQLYQNIKLTMSSHNEEDYRKLFFEHLCLSGEQQEVVRKNFTGTLPNAIKDWHRHFKTPGDFVWRLHSFRENCN